MSQTVQRAISILEFIAERPRTATEVAEHLGVHRTTALRLAQSLQDGGLVRRQADGRYGVGFRLTGLAQLALDQFDLAAVARPYLVELGERCDQTIHLATLERDTIVYTDKIEPTNSVRMRSQIGHPVCLHTAGVSKAILAFLPQERLDDLLAGYEFERMTDTTITSAAAFRTELERVRERGWATDDGELEDYVNCIAVPIWSSDGAVVAAVSVTALRVRADLDKLGESVPLLRNVGERISNELGWRP